MRAWRWLSWAVPLAYGAVLLCADIGEPWTGSYDANGALFSTVARNTLRYGLAATRGGQVVNGGELTPDRFRFYAHHPPGLPLAMAASFAVFGEHEWSARLVPILCTLGAAALVYVVAWKLSGPWAGFLAAVVLVSQPMVAFYGRMPDHEAPAALFILALVALYLGWRRAGGRVWLLGMSVVAFVGVWFAWIVVLMPWLLLGCGWLNRSRRARGLLVPALAALLGFVTVLGHVALVAGGLAELGRALMHRAGSQASDRTAQAFTFGEFLVRQGEYFGTCFGVVALCLALGSVAELWRRRGGAGLLVAALAVLALANVFGFRQGAFVHIYYQFYVALPIALAAGVGLGGLVCREPNRGAWVAAALVVAAGSMAVGGAKWDLIRGVTFAEDEAQVRLAESVREKTRAGDRILVVWGMGSSFRQLTYYADRDITVVPAPSAAARLVRAGRFDWRVTMEGDSAEKAVFERLRPAGPSAPGPPPGQ